MPVLRTVLPFALAVCMLGAAGGLAGWGPWRAPHAQAAGADFAPPDGDICIVRPALPLAGAEHPYDPASGLAMHAARPVPAAARCAVCGMYPARHPAWATQVIYADGKAWFFDSAVDMVLFLDAPRRYTGGRDPGAVAARYVSDHAAGGGWVEADAAWFVLGSVVRGPMRGPDLPAFATRAAAETFAAAHGGRVLRFAELDARAVAAAAARR